MEGLQRGGNVVLKLGKWPPQRLGPCHENIVMTGSPIKGKQGGGGGAQAAFRPVSFDRGADPAGGGEPDANRFRLRKFFRRGSGFKRHPGRNPADAVGAAQEIRPVLQPVHLQQLWIGLGRVVRPKAFSAHWPGGGRAPCGRQRLPCGRESHGGASSPAYSADRCVSWQFSCVSANS